MKMVARKMLRIISDITMRRYGSRGMVHERIIIAVPLIASKEIRKGQLGVRKDKSCHPA